MSEGAASVWRGFWLQSRPQRSSPASSSCHQGGPPSRISRCHFCHKASLNPASELLAPSSGHTALSAPLLECSLGSRRNLVNGLHSGPLHERVRPGGTHVPPLLCLLHDGSTGLCTQSCPLTVPWPNESWEHLKSRAHVISIFIKYPGLSRVSGTEYVLIKCVPND